MSSMGVNGEDQVRKVLEGKLSVSEMELFNEGDLEKLYAHGFRNADALDAVTEKTLMNVFPERLALVGIIHRNFQPPERERERPSWRALSDNCAMVKFVGSLANKEVQEQLIGAGSGFSIDLPDDVYWFGDCQTFTNQIFVRKAYLELKEARLAYLKGKKGGFTIFTGTPGIGKSHFAALMAAEFLIEGRLVILQRTTTESEIDFYKLQLSEDGHAEVEHTIDSSTAKFSGLQSGKKTVFIVDGGHSKLTSMTGGYEYLVFASAQQEVSRLYRKNPECVQLYVPLFDLKELQACAMAISRFRSLSKSQILEWFALTGGIARTVLYEQSIGRSLEEWKNDAIAKMTPQDMEKTMTQLGSNAFATGSDMLFHWTLPELEDLPKRSSGSPEKDNLRKYKTKRLKLASPQIAGLLSLKLGLEQAVGVAKFCMKSSGQLETAALKGYWLEHLGHIRLTAGGEFQCRLLGKGSDYKIRLQPSVISMFHSLTEAAQVVQANCGKYCLPHAQNFAAIDSLISPVLFFQFASGRTHNIDREGLQEVLKAMRKVSQKENDEYVHLKGVFVGDTPLQVTHPLLVFVTDKACYDEGFTDLQIYTRKGKKCEQEPLVLQAVLRLPFDTFEQETKGEKRKLRVSRAREDYSNQLKKRSNFC